MDLFSAIYALAALLLLYAVLSFAVTAIEVLLTTILRLRSKHLERQLRAFISSNAQNIEFEQKNRAQKFIEILYESPYIKSLSFENKLYYSSNKVEDLSDSSDAITTALIDTLRINWLLHKLTEIRLKRFIGRIKNNINRIVSECNLNCLLEQPRFKCLERDFSDIISSFDRREIDILACIDLILNNLDTWLNSFDDHLETKKCVEQLIAFKSNFFNKDLERLKASAGLSPNSIEIVNAIDITSPTFAEVKSNLNGKDHEMFKDFEIVLSTLPKSLINNLYSIAERTEASSTGEESISKFYEEIKVWFRKALQKEESTYRRNSRALAWLIGYILVGILNVDAFNFFSTLTYRSDIRDITIDSIKDTMKGNQSTTREDLDNRLKMAESLLGSFPSPIGWSRPTLNHQIGLSSTESFNPLSKLSRTLSALIGWTISSGAISMGGSFWLDLFSKFVNIKR